MVRQHGDKEGSGQSSKCRQCHEIRHPHNPAVATHSVY